MVGEFGGSAGLKIRLTRTGDAFSIAKQQQGKEDGTEETTTPTTTGGNEGDEEMVNHVAYPPSPVKTIMPIESSAKIRKDREDENNDNNNSAIIETPSKKSRHSGKNGVPDNTNTNANATATATAAIPVVAAGQRNLVQDSGESNPHDVTKSIRMESHQDTTGIQETTNTEGGDNGMDAAAEPSKETAMPLKTPESAARPEPPAGDVYRIPSYAGGHLNLSAVIAAMGLTFTLSGVFYFVYSPKLCRWPFDPMFIDCLHGVDIDTV